MVKGDRQIKKKPAVKNKKPESKPILPKAEKQEEFKIRKIKVKVVGLGGGGAGVVSEISGLLKSQSFVAADTDIRTGKKIKKGVKFFQFGQNLLQGMGTGMNTDLAEKVALLEQEKIETIFKDQDICVLVGCLGGGVASGAGPVFSQAAKNQKCISIGIFTLPFDFEGEKKMKTAKKSLGLLKENLSGAIVVSNERIFQLTDRKISLKKALSFLNQVFALWLVELLDILLKPSLINIDFADLRTILKDRGHDLFFSQAQTSGANRAEEVVKKLFQNNLLAQPPKNVKRALFNVAGGKDLKLKEVEVISEEVFKLNPKAKIIFGVSQLPSQKDKIKAMLLAVCEDDKKSRLLEEIVGAGDKNKRATEKNGKGNKNSHKKSPAENGHKKLTKPTLIKNKVGQPLFTLEQKEEEKIRRTAVEVQKADEEAEKMEWAGDTNWDIPAFLRDQFKK